MAFVHLPVIPFRRSGTSIALLLALPGHAAQTPPASPSPTAAEDSAAGWARFTALWQALDTGDKSLSDPAVELAACFGAQGYELEHSLRGTEMEAAGIPAKVKTLAPARYALATLAMTQINLRPRSPESPVAMTRMAILPIEVREHTRFQGMEQIAGRIGELRRQLGKQGSDLVLTGLSGIRMDVYRYRALRMAVEIHRRLHPMGGEACKPGQTEAEAEAEARSLAGFLRDPSGSPIGTDAWIAQYREAVQRLQRDLKAPQAAQLRQQESLLADALQHLDASRSRLVVLFTDLENKSAAH